MTSQYPDRIDNFGNVSGTDPMTDHAQRHDNEQDGIEQVQLTLGTNPQGSFNTVRDRMNAADTSLANAVADLAAEEETIDEHTFDIACFWCVCYVCINWYDVSFVVSWHWFLLEVYYTTLGSTRQLSPCSTHRKLAVYGCR